MYALKVFFSAAAMLGQPASQVLSTKRIPASPSENFQADVVGAHVSASLLESQQAQVCAVSPQSSRCAAGKHGAENAVHPQTRVSVKQPPKIKTPIITNTRALSEGIEEEMDRQKATPEKLERVHEVCEQYLVLDGAKSLMSQEGFLPFVFGCKGIHVVTLPPYFLDTFKSILTDMGKAIGSSFSVYGEKGEYTLINVDFVNVILKNAKLPTISNATPTKKQNSHPDIEEALAIGVRFGSNLKTLSPTALEQGGDVYASWLRSVNLTGLFNGYLPEDIDQFVNYHINQRLGTASKLLDTLSAKEQSKVRRVLEKYQRNSLPFYKETVKAIQKLKKEKTRMTAFRIFHETQQLPAFKLSCEAGALIQDPTRAEWFVRPSENTLMKIMFRGVSTLGELCRLLVRPPQQRSLSAIDDFLQALRSDSRA